MPALWNDDQVNSLTNLAAKNERERIISIVRAVEEEADLDTEHGVGWSQACRSIDNRISRL